MKRYIVVLTAVAVLAASACSTPGKPGNGSPGGPAPSGQADPSALLGSLEGRIGTALEKMDHELASAAGRLAETGLAGPRCREILVSLLDIGPGIVDCAAVSPEGRMVTIEPGEFHEFEGADISNQAQVLELHRTRRPVLSRVFQTVEGFPAVDLEHPVFGREGEPAGSVSLLFRPEEFLAALVEPIVRDLAVEVWIMQTDGRILYDADREEIGRMLFTDPMYQGYPCLLYTSPSPRD